MRMSWYCNQQWKRIDTTETEADIKSSVENYIYIFKLSLLHGLYVNHLHDLGVDKTINKTRLKMVMLGQFHNKCREQSDGKNILLAFNEGLKLLLKDANDSRLMILKQRLFQCLKW